MIKTTSCVNSLNDKYGVVFVQVMGKHINSAHQATDRILPNNPTCLGLSSGREAHLGNSSTPNKLAALNGLVLEFDIKIYNMVNTVREALFCLNGLVVYCFIAGSILCLFVYLIKCSNVEIRLIRT